MMSEINGELDGVQRRTIDGGPVNAVIERCRGLRLAKGCGTGCYQGRSGYSKKEILHG
jgi:hypothetical protein